MAKDPAFLFYYQDFLVGTDEMDNETVGAYIRCLCHQAHKGFITKLHMSKICNSHEIHSVVIKKFITEDNGDTYYNKRLRYETEKRQKYSESRSNNRKKAYLKNSEEENICKTYDNHMENEIENKNEVEKEKGGMGEKTKSDIDYDEVKEFFNQHRNKMPEIKSMNDTRKKVFKSRVLEHDKKTVGKVIKIAGSSNFLNGDNDRAWVANFDWLMKPTNFIKVLEGNYISKQNKNDISDEFKASLMNRIINGGKNISDDSLHVDTEYTIVK